MAADFHFTSPLDNRLDRETFFARCWPNSETMRSLDLKRVVSDGATVFVTYELTYKEGHRLRNSEVLTVRDNQVIEVEVYFGWTLPHGAPLGGYLEGEERQAGNANYCETVPRFGRVIGARVRRRCCAMTAKEVAKRIVHHVFAWVLLLALGIAAILGGIAIVDSGYRNTLIIWSRDGAGLENVVIFLVASGVAFGVWLIRGVSTGMWTLSTYGVLLIIVCALVGLAFGMVGIGALVGMLACTRVLTKNRNGT